MDDWPDPLDRYLRALFARARPSTLVEVRWRTQVGMNRRFARADALDDVAGIIAAHASSTDVYVGVLPRWQRRGGRAAVVGDARTLWVDLDTPEAEARLASFEPTPHLLVRSGGPGHIHAYWTLRRAIAPGQVEWANRRLAWALGADLSSTDAARILRPPQTLNHGRDGAPVDLLSTRGEDPVGLGGLVGGLPDPPVELVPDRRSSPRRSSRDALLNVEPERYVAVLTGQQVGRSRKVSCPLHEDSTPSLQVYRDPSRGWFCFGCRRGGSIYDLAGAVWGIEPRGAGFTALREGLHVALGHAPGRALTTGQ